MTMNPVLRKDLLGLLRLKRVVAIEIAFLAALAGLVLATWPQTGVVTIAMRGRDDLLLGLILGQLVLLILVVPGVAATGLSGEREANTLDMLYASRVSPAQIAIGKVLSATSLPLILLATGLPFAALLTYRGEVNLYDLTICYLILLLGAIAMAAVSLMVSAIARRTDTALLITYVIMLIVNGGLLVPAAIMLKSQSGPAAMALHYARSLSPAAAVLSVLRPQLGELGGRRAPEPEAAGAATAQPGQVLELEIEETTVLLPSWQVFLPLSALCILACTYTVHRRLSRPSPDAERPTGQAAKSAGSSKQHVQPRPMGRVNPVYCKESRTVQLRSGRWMTRIFYASLVLSLTLAIMSLYGGIEHPDLLAYVSQIIVAFQLALVALVVPSLTSSTISSEIETGTFESLRLTRLTAAQVFWGKFLPAFLPALLPILALIPAYAAICFVSRGYIPFFLRLLPVMAAAVAMCCTLGLACSCWVANTARATVVSYLVTSAVFVLPLLCWWGGGSVLHPQMARWCSIPSPLSISLYLLPAQSADGGAGDLWRYHLVTVLGICGALLALAWVKLSSLLRHGA